MCADFENLLKGDKAAIQSLVDLNMTLVNKMYSLDTNTKTLASQIQPALDRLAIAESEINFLRHENCLLRQQIALNEDATKTSFLRIEGLQEANNENLVNRVASTLSNTGIQCLSSDIDYVKRIGQYHKGTNRPILVRFVREGVRNSILYNRNNINNGKTSHFIWINDDVSDFTRRQRKTTRDITALAKINGEESIRVHGDGLIVGDTKYKHTDLDLLPPHLSIEKAKSRSDEDCIYFQGESNFLSNFYPARFHDEDGILYSNVEQAYQYKKARFHNKISVANKILCERDPYEIKRLSKKVPNSSDWSDQEQSTMKKLLCRKFTQNQDLADALLETDCKQLHEASADPKWAIGAELASKACLTTSWTGQDILGQLIEEVREELRNRDPPQSVHANFALTESADHTGLNLSSTPLPEDDIDPSNEPTNDHIMDTEINAALVDQSPVAPKGPPPTTKPAQQQQSSPVQGTPASTPTPASAPTPAPASQHPVPPTKPGAQTKSGVRDKTGRNANKGKSSSDPPPASAHSRDTGTEVKTPEKAPPPRPPPPKRSTCTNLTWYIYYWVYAMSP